jgi:hypothetical protein
MGSLRQINQSQLFVKILIGVAIKPLALNLVFLA